MPDRSTGARAGYTGVVGKWHVNAAGGYDYTAVLPGQGMYLIRRS